MNNTNKIKSILLSNLNLEKDVIWDMINYRDYGWDSIVHMQLISEFEDEFNIMFNTDDIIEMNSFNKIIEILKKYDVEF